MDQAPPRYRLQPHPAMPADAVDEVSCSVVWIDAGNWALNFYVDGPQGGLHLPAAQAPARIDGLWRTTCFELFLRREREESYFEFNFSPSGQWAAYSFEGYRQGGADLGMDGPAIHCPSTPDGFRLQAACDGASFTQAGPWRVGLSAVIEEASGTKSYWALAHPSEKPDFHHPDSFVLELP